MGTRRGIRGLIKLLHSPWHECRLTAVLIPVRQFERGKTDDQRRKIHDTFMDQLDYINNRDLVDSSCHKIAGPWLFGRSRKPLYKLASSKNLWRNRVAIVTTCYFIKRDDLADTFSLSEKLMNHPHELIHKAVGWMLREAGNRNEAALTGFLDRHAARMPRTALRCSLEKLDAAKKNGT